GTAQTSALCLGSTVSATSSCSVVTPAVGSAGLVDVVAHAFGTSSPISPADQFTYDEFPALTKFQVLDASSGIATAVFLNGNAPAGGAVIALTSSDPSVVSLPPTMTIPAGSQSTSVPLTFLPTSRTETVTVSATYQGSSLSATL